MDLGLKGKVFVVTETCLDLSGQVR